MHDRRGLVADHAWFGLVVVVVDMYDLARPVSAVVMMPMPLVMMAVVPMLVSMLVPMVVIMVVMVVLIMMSPISVIIVVVRVHGARHRDREHGGRSQEGGATETANRQRFDVHRRTPYIRLRESFCAASDRSPPCHGGDCMGRPLNHR